MSMIKEMSVRAIVHATESITKVKEAIAMLAPDAKLRESHTTGYHGNEIVLLEVTSVQNCKDMEELLKRDGILEEVLKKPEIYIDKGRVHLRLDKQVLYAEKRLVMGCSDAISVHLQIGSKTETREKTANRIKKFLRGEEE